MTTTEETTVEEEAAVVVDADEVCASCGVAAIDDTKLKNCDGGCDLVKYCSNECQDNRREQHEEECMKRLSEIRDRDLFTMPDGSHLGECLICCLPLDESKSNLMPCCCKYICNGCAYANAQREIEAGLEQRCAFCREPVTETGEERDKNIMERVKKNCPVAMRHMGGKRHIEGDYEGALEYFTRAAELGNAAAHHALSIMYYKGEGVEKDVEKHVYHEEQAAIGGHPAARYNLGVIEMGNGRFERAKKHFIIAANRGHEKSPNGVRGLYADGHASKEDYANALRAYQAAVEATKSPEREEAEETIKNGDW